MSASPLAENALPTLFEKLGSARKIGIAVSGGPDSTALLVLLDRWRRRFAPEKQLHVLTVDHGLRPQAQAECAHVVRFAASLGYRASLLTWKHDAQEGPPKRNVQAAARQARTVLLLEHAHAFGLDAVALGHTRDDKAETFLMRLARGAGVAGLAAMEAVRVIEGVFFVRPLLDVSKAQLIATLREAGVSYVCDPANEDTARFLRARVRKLLPRLAEIGLTTTRLAASADRFREAARRLDAAVDKLQEQAAEDHAGVIALALTPLLAAEQEVALRLLARCFLCVRPGPYPPRMEKMEDLLLALHTSSRETGVEGALFRRRTLGGVVAEVIGARLWLYAEAGRAGFPKLVIETAGHFVWDGRFMIVVENAPPVPLIVEASPRSLKCRGWPARAMASLPVIRPTNGKSEKTDPPAGAKAVPLGVLSGILSN